MRRDALAVAVAVSATAASISGAYGRRRVAALTKPIPMLILGLGVVRRRSMPRLDTALLVAAVSFSMAGDRAMWSEEFSPRGVADTTGRADLHTPLSSTDRRLAWGATFFAGAQAAYCTLLWRRGARPHVRTLLPRVCVLAESAAVVGYYRPRLLPILAPYGNSLALMSALAADVPGQADGPGQAERLRIGGLLFVASDLTILNRRHLMVSPRLRRLAELWVLASYFSAQTALVNGLSAPRER